MTMAALLVNIFNIRSLFFFSSPQRSLFFRTAILPRRRQVSGDK
jgi:hypothetical protein